jgi:uncharacterized protein YndB with AHSA1/START domain
MTSRIMAIDPPRSLSFTWEDGGEVTFDLAPAGDRVLLTITHRRLRGRDTMLAVSAGWHAHADILEATLLGRMPQPFWDSWTSLRNDYDRRLPHVEAGRPREPGEKR